MMTSKEALEEIVKEARFIFDYKTINGKRYTPQDLLNTIKQDLERLEVLEIKYKDIKNSHIQECKYTIEVLEENKKLKKAISLLNLFFGFEIDVETETIYCCLGDVSVNGANLYEDFKLLKEVLGE